jgi:hypothetical protein
LNSDEEGINRIDDESDRTYDDHLVGKTKVSSRGRIINVTPKILNQKNKKAKKKRKSKAKSKVRTEKNIDRLDIESDRIYDDDFVGKKLSCRYETGWYMGKIEYFNIKLKEYIVFFDDGSHDCIKKDDINDGVDIILLDWFYRSAKRRSMPKDAEIRQDNNGGGVVFRHPTLGLLAGHQQLTVRHTNISNPNTFTLMVIQANSCNYLFEKQELMKTLRSAFLFSNNGETETAFIESLRSKTGIEKWQLEYLLENSKDYRLENISPTVEMFNGVVDIDDKIMYPKVARELQGLDCFLEKIEIYFENNAGSNEERKNKCSKCEDSFIFERSLKKHITSVHVETMPENPLSKEKIKVKVIKAKKNCQKLARQPCKNVSEGFIHEARILPKKAVIQRQGPELIVENYVGKFAKIIKEEDDCSAEEAQVAETYLMEKRPKLSEYHENFLMAKKPKLALPSDHEDKA